MGQVRAASGIDVAYEVHGEGPLGAVLLICGTGQQAALWAAMGTVDGLVDAGYRVVTFDNRGMVGAACPTPPWTVSDMADDAEAVLLAVGPAHVLGVSLGGLISQTLALRRPDLVRTAILMVGGGHFGPAWGPVMTGFVELYASGTVPPEPIQRFLMLQAMLTPEQRSDPAMVDLAVALAGGLTDSFGPGGQHGQYSASATWITEDHLSELTGLTVPVLVIANEHDPVFPPSGRHAMTALLPNSTYVEIPGVSHVAMDPASLTATMAAVVGFLAAH